MAKRPSDVQSGPGFFDGIDEPDRPASGRRLIVEADPPPHMRETFRTLGFTAAPAQAPARR